MLSQSDPAHQSVEVIALDGPSGTGKSTVARRLALRLGIRYLDTGSMYRAATVAALRAGADLTDPDAILQVVLAHPIEVGTDPRQPYTRLDGDPVDTEIRSAATTAAVSAVSAIPGVRQALVAQQRQLIAAGPTVAEGRDVGSVVWPEAGVKVYLTAADSIRAQRRAMELAGSDQLNSSDIEQVKASLRRRDELDSSRPVSPLRRPDGAIEIDTSRLSVDEVLDLLVQLALRDNMPAPARG